MLHDSQIRSIWSVFGRNRIWKKNNRIDRNRISGRTLHSLVHGFYTIDFAFRNIIKQSFYFSKKLHQAELAKYVILL